MDYTMCIFNANLTPSIKITYMRKAVKKCDYNKLIILIVVLDVTNFEFPHQFFPPSLRPTVNLSFN